MCLRLYSTPPAPAVNTTYCPSSRWHRVTHRGVWGTISDAAVEDEVVPYLSTAPKAVAAAKRLARRLGPRIDAEVIADSIDALVAVWEDDEAPEGIAAFFAKRKPRWQA